MKGLLIHLQVQKVECATTPKYSEIQHNRVSKKPKNPKPISTRSCRGFWVLNPKNPNLDKGQTQSELKVQVFQ